MSRLYQIATIIFVVAISVPVARSQEQPQTPPDQTQQPQPQGAEQPIPAYKSPLASQADNGDVIGEPMQLGPDNRPLTGIQDLSLGVPLDRHSYWQPHGEVDFTADSEPPQSGAGGWTTWTTLVGGVDVHTVFRAVGADI